MLACKKQNCQNNKIKDGKFTIITDEKSFVITRGLLGKATWWVPLNIDFFLGGSIHIEILLKKFKCSP